MKLIKIFSWFLGIAMFCFGVLKFVNPFKTWYSVQVFNSGLNSMAYWAGIAGEILTGFCLILTMALAERLSIKNFQQLIAAASTIIIVMMLSSFYVHFHPAVPASVLPLKIKPPVVPGFFFLIASANLFLIIKPRYNSKSSSI